MMLPYDEVCQHGLGSQGRAEGRQQASQRGSIAVVVELARLVMIERDNFHVLTTQLPVLLHVDRICEVV
jgi:hypothetical protein